MFFIFFFFFFQAEDGIRDVAVTGVQTCALPICNWSRKQAHRSRNPCWPSSPRPHHRDTADNPRHPHCRSTDPNPTRSRSEEHTSELQSRLHLVCRLLLEKKKKEQVRHRL